MKQGKYLDAIQSFAKKNIHIARTDAQFKTLRAEVKGEINGLRAEIKALDDKVSK
ncbi:hypothetical protein RIF25_15065 [Thermosynechococcaceae cyanobacterium BACA0444]|uniref:Uncharacterized protein n=1 Tax=Pseudocalidococcus azoricus BACA0444 TaxID=2918990 RepID=A0AAE4K0P4_9CYAN|nr:hypothetical protein [Pseudocalidococcus azoricus]MDS3862122.1 hypothetical protein [Pseudocalidococcus azoricus BACA0444]